VQNRYVGFYWTLPVLWAGFKTLPENPVEAARASKTIRYQQERARRFIDLNGGEIIAEFVFIETAPDRGTEFIRPELQKAIRFSRDNGATLLYVDFHDDSGWRNHSYLANELAGYENVEPLDLQSFPIDGKFFCPIKHFRQWRALDKTEPAKRHRAALAGLRAAALKYAGVHRRHKAISDYLNAENIPPTRAPKWTRDNVKKHLDRYADQLQGI
jgi:hypothetical protein